MNAPKPSAYKTVETIKHDDEKRRNIPTAEYQSLLQKEEAKPRQLRYPRNTDLDQLLDGAARTNRTGAT
jgi:adenine-specific DNA-methyltransferase